MSAADDLKGDPLPGRTGPILKQVRRGKNPGDRIARALAIPAVKPGAGVSGMQVNDYADRRRASFGFAKGDSPAAGWHCTPPGWIDWSGEKRCGKATCRFCWVGRVADMLNGLHARQQVCEAAGVPCSFRFVRLVNSLVLADFRSLTADRLATVRRAYKKEVDSRQAGTAAGAWVAGLLLPYPEGVADVPLNDHGVPCEAIEYLFGVKAFEGPAVRSAMEPKPNRRELDVPGELLNGHLKANSPLVDFFAPRYDFASLPAGASRTVRDLWGKSKRVTAYGTLRPKKQRAPISGNGDDAKAGGADDDADDEGAGDEGKPPVEQVSNRPPPMRPLGESLPDKPE